MYNPNWQGRPYNNRRRDDRYSGYATAPYNFITYNNTCFVPPAEETNTYSGSIRCSLKALTPLLVAAKQGSAENKERRFLEIDGKPVIPGTSLKGMIRSLVEIMSFSCMRPVSGKHIFWRDVTGDTSSRYKEPFQGDPLGGWLVQKGALYRLYPVHVEPRERLRVGARTELYTTGPMSVKGHGMGCKSYYFAPKKEDDFVVVDKEVVDDFFQQMTPAQEINWKNEKDNIKNKGARVFYTRDKKGNITALGTARYFRIAYEKTPADLAGKCEEDFATALFGSVKSKQAVRGRVSFSAATFSEYKYREPQEVVLGEPHPSCILHYLNQPNAMMSDNYKKKYLEDYNGKPVLRGRKYYWHRNYDPLLPPNSNEKVRSKIHPMDAGAQAEFTVWVDRVSSAELGALLEALDLPKGHAHKLGLGKSMGMGSVRIEIEKIDVRPDKERYASLSARFEARQPKSLADFVPCRSAFKKHVEKHISYVRNYEQSQSITELRLMMNYVGRPANNLTATMQLTTVDKKQLSFKSKSLLPSPQTVKKGNK